MKILFVSSQALFRETRFGGAKRLYYLARELEARAELHVICMDGCGEVPDPAAFPHEFNRLLLVPPERSSSALEKLSFLPDITKALTRHRREISAFVGTTRFDATLIAFSGALHFLDMGLLPHPGRIVYLEDDFLLEQLRLRIHDASNPLRRILDAARYLQGVRFYRRNMKRASEFVCISPQEERIVQARWPELATSLLGYGLPLGNYPLLPGTDRKNVLGFIGNYRHSPNLDAADWLVNELFPVVLSQLPDARLVLCGAGFPDELRKACAENESIQVLDEVDDLGDFYRGITVFVNPLRKGRGLRTKLVEAAAYGRPILSTPLGAEGLEGFRLGLFETGEELAAGLRALDLPEVYAEQVGHNRAQVERTLSMESLGDKLMDILGPG
jgi:glycosyltransferase involved in cell wall biosynthesis